MKAGHLQTMLAETNRWWRTTLRDHVIAPILAGIRLSGPGQPPKTRTRIDHEHLRTGMRTLFHDLAINTAG